MGKRILVIGSGGRETALVRNLHRDETIEIIYCAPGNDSLPLIGKRARNVPGTDLKDHSALIRFAEEARIDLTIVGPEKPLVDGIVDSFTAAGLRIVGPTCAAARLEGSKAFCKHFLRQHNIRTPGFEVFNNADRAARYIHRQIPPIVVKADGLAGGKGVIVAQKRNDAVEAARRLLEKHSPVVIEKFARGCECSLMALTDGRTVLPLLPVLDYKRALANDEGPNTGGMGCLAPLPLCDGRLRKVILKNILYPIVKGMSDAGTPYRGILYAGLMLTPDGPTVLEINCRFGDPELQTVLPLLDDSLLRLLEATVDGNLGRLPPHGEVPKWRCHRQAVCLVLASRGYPIGWDTDLPITGLPQDAERKVHVIHAGTKYCSRTKQWLTNGGRVLNIVASAPSFVEARERVYDAAACISFGQYPPQYRPDIAARVPESL